MLSPSSHKHSFKMRKVCKLDKALYGLKISSQRWNKHFTEVIRKFDFDVCPNDRYMFRWRDSDRVAFLFLYVDDMLISSNCKEKLDVIKTHLKKHSEMKNLGPPTKFLGL